MIDLKEEQAIPEAEIKEPSLCPLLSTGALLLRPCMGSRCAWWDGASGCCVIHGVAEIAYSLMSRRA